MAYRCRECGNRVGGVNPQECPVCGFTVFEPTGVRSETGDVSTEEFDTGEALDRLAEIKD